MGEPIAESRVVGKPIKAWKKCTATFFPSKCTGTLWTVPSQSCRNLQVDTVFNKKTTPRDEAESFSRHRVLRHLLRSLPTNLCGRCRRHIDVIFPIDQVVSDGVECVACDIDKVEFSFHALGHPFGEACQLLLDVFFESSTSPPSHLLNLGIRLTRQG